MKLIALPYGEFTKVDDEDFEWLSEYSWYVRYSSGKYRYAATHSKIKKHENIYMHRMIANPPEGMEVDHINHDTLDNQRLNLRICTHTENAQNSHRSAKMSGYKGVSCVPERKRKWRARIFLNKKQICLGSFCTSKEAALAYDKKARELFGEFAQCNFDTEGEQNV